METIKFKDLTKYELSELTRKGLFRRCIYQPTQSPVSKKEYYFAADDFTTLTAAMEHRHFDLPKELHIQPDGNVKLVVLRSKGGKFVAAQVFHYQPFEFSPMTEIVVLKEDEIASFDAMLGK